MHAGYTDQVEHSVGMSSKFGHLSERGILPHQDLVLRITVCADLQNIDTIVSTCISCLEEHCQFEACDCILSIKMNQLHVCLQYRGFISLANLSSNTETGLNSFLESKVKQYTSNNKIVLCNERVANASRRMHTTKKQFLVHYSTAPKHKQEQQLLKSNFSADSPVH